MFQTRAAFRSQEVVPIILTEEMRPFGRLTAGSIPEDLPVADLAGFKVCLCELEGGIYVPIVGANNV